MTRTDIDPRFPAAHYDNGLFPAKVAAMGRAGELPAAERVRAADRLSSDALVLRMSARIKALEDELSHAADLIAEASDACPTVDAWGDRFDLLVEAARLDEVAARQAAPEVFMGTNASLIAEAPALLFVLQQIVAGIERGESAESFLPSALAAIGRITSPT